MDIKVDNDSIEKIVQDHIKVAVAGVLSQKSDLLISKIVDFAINAKSRDSWDKETILDKQIGEAIRAEAQGAVQDWLATKRADIRKQVHAALVKKSDGLVAKVVEQLVVGLGEELRVTAYLNKDR